MAKFSDSNYKILDEYFTVLNTPRSGTDNSYVLGPRKTIVSEGSGNEVVLYQFVDGQYVGHRFLIQSIIDNNFKFQYRGKESFFSGAFGLTMGEEMYFRKDSFFHVWLKENVDDYEDFINVNKRFCYFGKIYPVSNEPNYNIIFEGLKDFAIAALPENNQTDRIKELFKIFFDYVYHDIYNMTKTLWSLFDAKEVNLEHLNYLATRAGIETDKDKVEELPLREFIDNLFFWLKRKGTYTAYQIIYKLFLENTPNKLNIYERWVEWNLRTIRQSNNYILDSDFEDHHVLEFYKIQPSGGAGIYYDRYRPGDYPIRHLDGIPIVGNFIDQGNTNHTVVGHGGVSLSTPSGNGEISKYGMMFNGSGYATVADHVDWDVQTDWSIDLRVKHTDHAGEENYISQFEDGINYWVFRHLHGTGLGFFVVVDGSNIIEFQGGEIDDFDLHHVLITKKGNEYGLYLDGIQTAYSNDAAMDTFNGLLYIGQSGAGSKYFDGQMEQVRIYHGNPFNASPNIGMTDTITVPTVPHISDNNTKLLIPGTPYGVISPHYKVEIDLSSEPLGEDYIIDADTANELLRYWAYIKPVSKFVHYHMLLSPLGKIDEAHESVSLYDSSLTAICDTRYTGTITSTAATSGGYYDDLYDDTQVYTTNISYSTWNIDNEFGSPELLIQTYDPDGNMIYPQSINYVDKDTLQIDWFGAVRGTAFLAGKKLQGNVGTAYYNTSGASAWDISHTPSPSGIVYQVYSGITNPAPSAWRFHDIERLVPNSVTSVSDKTLQLVFNEPVSGSVFIRNADYYHPQNIASTSWSIEHNMNIKGAIVQCWDHNSNRIYPENIQKISSNKYVATFSEVVSGYATLIAFKRDFFEGDVKIVAGYWKIGTGADDNFNPLLSNDLNSWSASGELTSFTDTGEGIEGYYVIEFSVPKSGAQTINEIGVFDPELDMLYYTRCSNLYKPDNVQLDVVYRIKKQV